jgi:hypothetical protein
LNQNTIDSNWRLDPRENFDHVFDASGIPSGIGNQVSAEFNMIYRWHAATSNHDEAWINDFMKVVFGSGVDPSKYFLFTELFPWTGGSGNLQHGHRGIPMLPARSPAVGGSCIFSSFGKSLIECGHADFVKAN